MNEWEWQLLEDKSPVDSLEIGGIPVRRGTSVRLHPRPGGDIFDLALDGKIASVESIEQDYEGNLHVCVVVHDDPGRDIGLMRQPGHRFFFSASEIEPVLIENLHATQTARKEILVAGIGNIFLGDDGFGVEVASRLSQRTFPAGVRVADFGIRSLDLAYALMEGYETTILIDAFPADATPGTLFVLEPGADEISADSSTPGLIDPHAMNPVSVLRTAQRMGGELKRVLVLGCVPATLGPEEGRMGLSVPVAAAADEAVKLVETLVTRILAGEFPAKK